MIKDFIIRTIQSETCLSKGTIDENSDRSNNFYQLFRISIPIQKDDGYISEDLSIQTRIYRNLYSITIDQKHD